MSDLNNKIKEIVAEKLGVDISKINDETRFIDDLGADSLDTMELVMALEDEFGIEITDAEAVKIQTLKDVSEFLESKKN